MKVAEPTGMILTSLISGALSIRPRKAPTPMHKQMVKTAISEINRMRRTETFAFFPIIVEWEDRAFRFLFVARFPKFMYFASFTGLL